MIFKFVLLLMQNENRSNILEGNEISGCWQLVASIWMGVVLKLGWLTANLVAASTEGLGGTDKYKKRM